MRMSYDDERALIAKESATFPAVFGLRAFPGEVFRLASPMAHFVIDGEAQIVIQREMSEGVWADMGRNTAAFLRAELREVRR